jgi:hypothetical protein
MAGMFLTFRRKGDDFPVVVSALHVVRIDPPLAGDGGCALLLTRGEPIHLSDSFEDVMADLRAIE